MFRNNISALKIAMPNVVYVVSDWISSISSKCCFMLFQTTFSPKINSECCLCEKLFDSPLRSCYSGTYQTGSEVLMLELAVGGIETSVVRGVIGGSASLGPADPPLLMRPGF